MTYVIYNKETTVILRTPSRSVGCYVENYKTLAAAKAALTRLAKKGKLGTESVPAPTKHNKFATKQIPYIKEDFDIAEIKYFRENIEKQETKKNLLSGKEFKQPVNTPRCCDPSSETYWSM
jgi:hypothetical protein